MKKILFLILLICNVVYYSFGNWNNVDVQIISEIQSLRKNQNQEKLNITIFPVLIKFNNINVLEIISKFNHNYKLITSNILTANIGYDCLNELANSIDIVRIERSKPMTLMMDSAKVHTKVDKVHNGDFPLSKKYTGKNVIVGIIDTGIDFTHKEFRNLDDTTKSKILNIWSMTDFSGNPPEGYDFGTEYSRSEIEDEIDGSPAGKVLTNDNAIGHGTHVSSIAAGNIGVAPDAILIVVQLDLALYEITHAVLLATNYIYKKADEYGLPCVINASVGSVYDIQHDGTDFLSEAIDSLVNAKPGRAFVCSAGNYGTPIYSHHWGDFEVKNDSVWTYLTSSSIQKLYFEIPKEYSSSLEFAIEVHKTNNQNQFEFIDRTPFFSVKNVQENSNHIYYKILTSTSVLVSEFDILTSNLSQEKVEMSIAIDRENFNNVMYKLYVKGNGKFHSFSSNYIGEPSNFNGGLPIDNQYINSDNNFMIGVPGVAKNAITVGSYVNKYTYKDTSGVENPIAGFRYIPGSLSRFSSHGPTTDNRMKPDISAPGELIVAAKADKYKAKSNTVVNDGKYRVTSGTSMSSPHVAGAVALLLEKEPNLDSEKIKNILKETAISDNFTNELDNLPNILWGWGKLNVFDAISKISEISVNEEIKKVNLFPNPANEYLNISFDSEKDGIGKIEIIDLLGKTFCSFENYINQGNNSIKYSELSTLPTATYTIKVTINNEIVSIGKFIKQ